MDPIEITYEQNFEKIYRFFYYKVLNRTLAEDLTSETFLQFVEEIKKRNKKSNDEPGVQNYNAFLFGVARIIFVKHLKKKYKEGSFSVAPEYFEAYVDNLLADASVQKPLEDRVERYIALLPASQREVAHLRLIAKCNNKEICEKLGKNMNYVKVTFKRALKSLKKLVACTP